MTNQEIAKLFRNVAAAYAIKGEGKYRFQIIAYQRAADAIENTATQVKDLYKEEKLELLPGVGKSISEHLEELMKTGKVKRFEWVFEGIPQSMFPLMDVPSLGPKKAYRLVMEFKLTNPETVMQDLEKNAKEGKIATLEGFGEKSQADIIRALDEFKQGKGKTTRMVLPYASQIADKLIKYLKQSPEVIEANTLGSLRRRKSTVGDIDIAISAKDPKKVVEYFLEYPYKDRMIEKGEMNASMLLTGGAQVDMITLPKEAYGSLLQHFTGSKNHNVSLREYAIKHGMSLSERGIKRKGKETIETYDTEEKFYNALGMDLIPPEIREDHGEIELALQHKLPKLVELKDIKGDLHIHSSFPIEPSHDMGKDTPEDMLKRAMHLGYEYFGFSEHNPSVSKHTSKQIIELLKKRKEVLDKLQEKYKKIKIIHLMETDILSDGSLALPEEALELLDATIVSIHSSFATESKEMTKRVLKGLSHPKAKILAHPTGRLLNERPGYSLDFDEVFAYVKKHNKALEINSWPERLDLPDIIVLDAVKAGVRMVIDTDSHALPHMDLMEFGVSVARRGWAEKKDIINTLTVDEFVKWLKG